MCIKMGKEWWVAPLVGAWIEIAGIKGLWTPRHTSLPLWERGLKSFNTHKNPTSHHIAPLVGAWIEISVSGKKWKVRTVAPLVGAWIEIRLYGILPRC